MTAMRMMTMRTPARKIGSILLPMALLCGALPARAGRRPASLRLAVERRARRIEGEISRLEALIRKDPNTDRAMLGDAAYPTLEGLVNLLRDSPETDRLDALIVTRLVQDLLRVDPGLYGNAPEIAYPLHDKAPFQALLAECTAPASGMAPSNGGGVPDLRALPDEDGLAAVGLSPVSEADVCQLRDYFRAIARLGAKGNG